MSIVPFQSQTTAGAPALRRGLTVPPDGVNLSWVKTPQITPANNVTVIDTSQIAPENINKTQSGLYYANDLGILQDINGNQLFGEPFPFITDQFSVSGNITNADLTQAILYPFKHVSRFFHIDAIGLCLGSELTDYHSNLIQVIDSNGNLYLDDNGNPLYRIQICPAINVNATVNTIGMQMPYRIYVYLDSDARTDLYLTYDKVEISSTGIIINQVLNYRESLNLQPVYTYRPEPAEVIDLANRDEKWFSSRDASFYDQVLRVNTANYNGFNIYVPQKALNDPRLFQTFRWRVNCTFPQAFVPGQQSQQTLHVGVIVTNNDPTSAAAQIWNALSDPSINLNSIQFINPLANTSDTTQNAYWYVNIDTLSDSNTPSTNYTQQLEQFDILVWVPTADQFDFGPYLNQINYFTNVLGRTLIIDTENGMVPINFGFETTDGVSPISGIGFHGNTPSVYAGPQTTLTVNNFSSSQLQDLAQNNFTQPFSTAQVWDYDENVGPTYSSGFAFNLPTTQQINVFNAASLGGWNISGSDSISLLQTNYGPNGGSTQFITSMPTGATSLVVGAYTSMQTVESSTIPTTSWGYTVNNSTYGSTQGSVVTAPNSQGILSAQVPLLNSTQQFLKAEVFQSVTFTGQANAAMATYLNGPDFNNLEHIGIANSSGTGTIVAGDYSINPSMPGSTVTLQIIDVLDNNNSNTVVTQSLSATTYYYNPNATTTSVTVGPNQAFTIPLFSGVPLLAQYGNIYFSTLNLISSTVSRLAGAMKLMYNICLMSTQNRPLASGDSQQFASSYQVTSPWTLSWVINTTSNPDVLSSAEKEQYDFLFLPAIAPITTITPVLGITAGGSLWGSAIWGTGTWGTAISSGSVGWGYDQWGNGTWTLGPAHLTAPGHKDTLTLTGWNYDQWGIGVWGGAAATPSTGPTTAGTGWGFDEWGVSTWDDTTSSPVVYIWQRQLSAHTLKELIDASMTPQMLTKTANLAREYTIEVTNSNVFVSSEVGGESYPFAWTNAYTPTLEIPSDYQTYIIQEKEIPATYESAQFISRSYPYRPYAFQVTCSYDDAFTLSSNYAVNWTAKCEATLTYDSTKYFPPRNIITTGSISSAPIIREVELSWAQNGTGINNLLNIPPYNGGNTALPWGLFMWTQANYHGNRFGAGQDNYVYNGLTGAYQNGSTGSAVQFLQDVLNKVSGAHLIIDGVYGPQTTQAVIDFQTKSGARYIDGITDAETWSLISGAVISYGLKNTGQSWGQFYDYAYTYMHPQSISDGDPNTVFGKRTFTNGRQASTWEIFTVFFGYENVYDIHGITINPYVIGNTNTMILDSVNAVLLNEGQDPYSYLIDYDSRNMMVRNLNMLVTDNQPTTIKFAPRAANYIMVGVGQNQTSFSQNSMFLGIRDIIALATISTPGLTSSTITPSTIPGHHQTAIETIDISLSDNGAAVVSTNIPVTVQCNPLFTGNGTLSNINWLTASTDNPNVAASITSSGKLTLVNNNFVQKLGVTTTRGPLVDQQSSLSGLTWYSKNASGEINPQQETGYISKDQGLVLFCNPDGTPFGFPSIPPSETLSQRQLSTYRLASVGTESNILIGFYDIARAEFITDANGNPAISYNDYITRGPNNIYVGAISSVEVDIIQTLPTFSPTNQTISNSDDSPYVPNMQVLPVYGVKTTSNSIIGLAQLQSNLGIDNQWPIAIKPGKFVKQFIIPPDSNLFQFQGSGPGVGPATPISPATPPPSSSSTPAIWGIGTWGFSDWVASSSPTNVWGQADWGTGTWTSGPLHLVAPEIREKLTLTGWGNDLWGQGLWGDPSSGGTPAPATPNGAITPGALVTAFYEVDIVDTQIPSSTLFGPPNVDILGETPIILDVNTIQVVQTPILMQQFPTNMDSPADPLIPIFTVYTRSSITAPWTALTWDQIADYNVNTGVISLQNVNWSNDPNLWMVNYTSSFPYYTLKVTDIVDFSQPGLVHKTVPINLNPIQNNYEYINQTLYIYVIPNLIIDSNGNQVIVENPYKYPISFTTNPDLFNPNSDEYDPSAVLLGLIRISNNFDPSQLTMIDSRARGGGIPIGVSTYQAYNTIQEAINYWDINYGTGMSYQNAGFVIIRLPAALKGTYPDSLIRDTIDRNIPAGVGYRIEDMNGNDWDLI